MLRYVTLAGLSSGLALLSVSSVEAQLVINEIDYDQSGSDTAEFIELKNIGAAPVNLSSYTLRLVNGAGGGAAPYQNFVLPAVNLAAGGYFVVCANPATVPNCDLDVTPNTDLIQNGPNDAAALVLGGALSEVVSYEGTLPGYSEGSTAPTDTGSAIESISRCPDGTDTNDNGSDFRLRPITPGAANNCGGGGGNLGVCGEPATLISSIQGSGATSPLVGQTHIVEGVVVADFQDTGLNGFYVQEQDSDSDANVATSEGIFVFEGDVNVPVAVGNLVRVLGGVTEFGGLTELTNIQVAVCPGAPAASVSVLALPVGNLTDLERLEGMRVQVPQTLTVTGNYEWSRYGSLDLSANGRLYQPTQITEPGAASIARKSLNERSRIVLDDGQSVENPNPIPYKDADNTRRLGSTVSGLSGILDDRFGAYRLQPTSVPNLVNATARPTVPVVPGRLRIASFNVLNFFSTVDTGANICGPAGTQGCRGADSAAELNRQREKLLNALASISADVFGLIEIENNASQAVQSLVDGLNTRLGAGTYAFVNTGTIGTDAIKLAFVYKPERVTPSGTFALLTSAVDPRFIDTRNRPALAQTFSELSTNAKLTVVLNHLKSKGSGCGAGDDDAVDGQGNCNGTRTLAAAALVDWLATDPTSSGDPDYLLIGDLNAYAMEDPIMALEDGGLQNLEQTFGGSGVYSYQFAGQSGTLDYALANASLAAQVTGTNVWHINSDEPVALGYNLEFKTDDPFNIADPFAASDHDPVIVGVNLTGGVPVAPVPASTPWTLLVLAVLLAGTGLVASSMRRHVRS